MSELVKIPSEAGRTIDYYLHQALQNKTIISVVFVNNRKVSGIVIGYSKYCITLKTGFGEVYVYKSAVAMITPFNPNNKTQKGKPNQHEAQ